MNDTRLKLMEAIARRRTVSTHYNGQEMILAPHQMFERHGALFVSALNLGKNFRSEEERRLGQFKLDGLGETLVKEEEFDPLPDFQPGAPSDTDILLLAV